MNIFEQLDMLLTEAETSSKVKESDIPIHPEMETKEQGEMAAAEKVLKLFQKLSEIDIRTKNIEEGVDESKLSPKMNKQNTSNEKNTSN